MKLLYYAHYKFFKKEANKFLPDFKFIKFSFEQKKKLKYFKKTKNLLKKTNKI